MVTGRNQLDAVLPSTSEAIVLDLFSQDAAREFLRVRLTPDRVEAEPEAVDLLIERSARLPLALAIVAARISSQPARFSLSSVAAELFDNQRTLDALSSKDWTVDIRAVLGASYASLSSEASRLFRVLALHPGSEITPQVAASLA